MLARQLPRLTGAMLLAFRQDFGGEHAVDLEKLEFHRVAAGIRRGVHEGQRPAEVAVVIGRGFGDEKRGARHGEAALCS